MYGIISVACLFMGAILTILGALGPNKRLFPVGLALIVGAALLPPIYYIAVFLFMDWTPGFAR